MRQARKIRHTVAHLIWLWLVAMSSEVAASEPKTILVMEGTPPGRQRDGLAERMSRYLRPAGHVLSSGRKLSDQQQHCHGSSCLLSAGAQEGADLAISAWIERDPTGQTWLVMIGCVMQNQHCEDDGDKLSGSNFAASKRDNAVLEHLLDRHLRKLQATIPDYSAVDITPSPAPAVLRRRAKWPPFLGTALGTLAAVTLISSITLAAMDHSTTDGNCRRYPEDEATACVWNLSPLYGPGFAASGLLLAGAGLSVGLSLR